MSAGVNYVGGRGRIAPRQSKNIERVPKAHFAKRRFIDYTQTAQGAQDTQNAKPVFTMPFKHAPKDDSQHDRSLQKAAASTINTQFVACFGPHVASRPSKPIKQSKLLEMMDGEIRRVEPFDASRSRISTMDTKCFAGLGIFPGKRKAGINERDHPQKRPHTASTQGSYHTKDALSGTRSLGPKRELPVTQETRAFISPPVKGLATVQLTQRGDSEEILASSVQGVSNKVEAVQPLSQVLPVEEFNATKVPNGTNLSVTRVDPRSQERPASPIIPPNLWGQAYLRAARTLGLPDPVITLELSPTSQGVPAGISVDHLVALNGDLFSNSAEDDATICAFNLVAPDLEVAFHGAPAAASPQTHLSDPPDSNEFECDSPVIIPAPGHGVPAKVDSQDGSGAAHGEYRVPRPEQPSDFDNRIGCGALASPPASHHPIGGLPVIQQVPIRSRHPWLGAPNGNIAGTITSPQIPSPWNAPNTKPRAKDQASGTNYRLEPDQEAPRPDTTAEPSQDSTQFTQPNSTNSFSLFGDDSDGESDG